MMQHIVEQGVAKLAVPLGSAGRSHALGRMSGLRTSPGWHVDGPAVREWRFEGFAPQPDGACLFGPEVAGRSLAEALALPLGEAAPLLGRLADALGTLVERAVPLFPLQSDAVVLDDRGGVLFLPPPVMREVRSLRPFAENRDTYEALNHPDLQGEALASFTLGACFYRAAVGRFPFTGADEEEIHEQARKLALQPPAQLVPGLREEASSLVMAALGRQRGRSVRIADWRAGVAAWTREGILRPVEERERERLVQEACGRERDAAKRFRIRTFWEKNWKIIGIAAAGVAVAGAVLGSILGGVFAPRATRGYSPLKVVETFYTSINSMNHSLMEDCVVDKAGQGEVNEAMNLYVLSRVQMGYEGKSNTVAADAWDGAGRPVLPAGTAVYGVTDLAITEVAGEPAPGYQDSYEKWMPDSGDNADPSAPAAIGTLRRRLVDRVSLRRDKGDWVIFRIDRLSEETLTPPETAAPEPVNPDAEPAPKATF
jgi:hypothetical protein